MFGIGFQEMVIILVVALIFFGPKRLPDLAKSIGKGIAEFKKASDEVRRGIDEAIREEPSSPGPASPPSPAGENPYGEPAAPVDSAGPGDPGAATSAEGGAARQPEGRDKPDTPGGAETAAPGTESPGTDGGGDAGPPKATPAG